MENIYIIYRGYNINFSENSEIWSLDIGDSSYRHQSLRSAKKHIDRLEEIEKEFVCFDAIIQDRGIDMEFTLVTVRSIDPEWGDVRVISKETGRRSKHQVYQLILDTEDNWKTIKSINELNLAIKELAEQKQILDNSLKRYSIPEV